MWSCKYFTKCCLFYFVNLLCVFFPANSTCFSVEALTRLLYIMLYSKFYVAETDYDSDVLIKPNRREKKRKKLQPQ